MKQGISITDAYLNALTETKDLDIMDNEIERRIKNKLIRLSVDIESLDEAIRYNIREDIDTYTYRVENGIDYLIPALNLNKKNFLIKIRKYVELSDSEYDLLCKVFNNMYKETESIEIDKSKTKYILEVRDPDKEILNLLQTIKEHSTAGHSFPVVVDPQDNEYKKQFCIDGDGSCQLLEIKVEENEE